MAGRGRGKFPSNSNQQKNITIQKCVVEDPVNIYLKMSKKFPISPNSESIRAWMKDVLNEVTMNPEAAIEIAKYLHLFTNITREDPSAGAQIKRSFLEELELSYNGYIQAESDSIKYRNFTYFFGASTYFVREPGNPPLKDLMAALLILISKLNIIEDIEDFMVYSKCVAWLSKLITDPMDGSVLSVAYKEALNRLRELISSGKGNLITLACLEKSINQGIFKESSREFYRECLSETDFKAVESDLSITIPVVDKHKFILDSFSNITYV
ncbi:uncharacterized protein [Halyomorpha halys]|uniref:uncharacterized protein n=1 Tax=Halyomorpha halys TaxID=286706 RepID=UPI0006D4E47A|nr:uncharacterized protein LOC106692952 [Halyomorpha halys]XP_014294718.1 uncharacterized protein LOC106692952 [Halyomorpha halys]XP_014294720.1 uncharacterized protein LOC106692952 [Halyomorpha halys]XP_014294721.1 uncharacterized protein LOC106692952 [Halyomorpha halys]XP_014294722.1 uncharacterized protein LOC106692952 [Halyomorpha halys]XP_014294723.1 uncharacterized protein LOC106692952 [Halyomorpha halys]